MCWWILFCLQPSMNNSTPVLATFRQSLSELPNDYVINIIINIAISDLSLHKVFNPNHSETSIIWWFYLLAFHWTQVRAWRGMARTLGNPPAMDMHHAVSATLRWKGQRPWKDTPEWSSDMAVKPSGALGCLHAWPWGKLLQWAMPEHKHMKKRIACKSCHHEQPTHKR